MRTAVKLQAIAAIVVCVALIAGPAGARGHRPRRLPDPPMHFCDHVRVDVEALAHRGGGVPGFWYWRQGTDPSGVNGPLHYPYATGTFGESYSVSLNDKCSPHAASFILGMVYNDVVERGAVRPTDNTVLRSPTVGYICEVHNARFGAAPAFFPFFSADCRMPVGTKVIHFRVAPDLHLPPQLHYDGPADANSSHVSHEPMSPGQLPGATAPPYLAGAPNPNGGATCPRPKPGHRRAPCSHK
jgi:hypothetical protein